MPFYTMNEALPTTVALRAGLDDLRSARYKLAQIDGILGQMTDAQVQSQFGFGSEVTAAAAKMELQAGIGKLLSTDPGINMQQTQAAVVQLLNQFG